ncbi:MAG TPA: hypothetical protein VKZ63_10415 [Kofleriaceae bacterium]|nr:hypothetical protein [Kofleriaceae bacterium]
MTAWQSPSFVELAMSGEIGSYRGDLDGPAGRWSPEPPCAREGASAAEQ